MLKRFIYCYLSVWLFALLPICILAKPIDYYALPDSLQLHIRLKSFLLISPESNLPDSIFSSETGIPLAFYYDGGNQKGLIKRIKAYSQNHSQIIVISKEGLVIPGSIQAEIIIYNPEGLDSVKISAGTLSGQSYDSCFSNNDLLLADITNAQTNCEEACFKLWQGYGKLPNFLKSSPPQFSSTAGVISKLNHTLKIFGAVYENDKLLPAVSWENSPGVKTYGYFCFPLIDDVYRRLIPYKAGYRFSPDIIHQSGSNMGNMKIFHGIKHEPDYGLMDDFTFNGKARNEQRGNDKELITNGVQFEEDAEHGGVAFFANRAYIDAGLQSKESLKSNFSITAWVKPTKLGWNNSILGKGKNFVLKIHNGKLTYTMQGVKDYISESTPVPVNTWTHVGMVYSRFNNRIYFYLNGEHTDEFKLIADYAGSDYTLIIGSNLWEEFFTGYLGEIKIWGRELNEDEIHYQYLNSRHETKSALFIWALILMSGAGLALYFILKKIGVGRKQLFQTKSRKPVALPEKERISCFGGLNIIDSEGINISLKFSPKLKQLFTLIFLYSQGDKKGITSRQLTETLWAGMNAANAKNSRGTYVQNLRSALLSFKKVKLVFNDKLWFLDIEESCFNEYKEVERILAVLHREKDVIVIENLLPPLIAILKQGRFMANMEESWLDPFIEKMNNHIIEFCISMFDILDNRRHAALLFDLAEIISLNDPLNEPALQKRIVLLIEQGKHSFAHSVYDNFIRLYKELYKEDYSVDFKDLIIGNSRLDEGGL